MLSFRKAESSDTLLYFNWVNDVVVREQSFGSNKISLEQHKSWFKSKLFDRDYYFFLFENEIKEPVGQVRIQKENLKEAIIGISIDHKHRGKGYSKKMLEMATESFFTENPYILINAFIKETNLSSKFAFQKAGFKFIKMIDFDGYRSFHYLKQSNS
jgi:RimJ/RimL family protein N-acetyltransferase